jgi:short-subunit dehydrogenase
MATETVLITGASSGIGLEMARLFAADGANLVLVARSEDRLATLATELRESCRVEVAVLPRDLAQSDAPIRIFEDLQAQGRVVDVVVNNAGFGLVGPLAQLPVEGQMDMMQVNVAAVTHLTRLFLPGMLQLGAGGVLNVASTAAFQPGPTMAVYFASKAYVLSLSEALFEEVAGTGVTVCCLAPGPTETGFGAKSKMERSLLFRLGTMNAAAVARAGYRGFRDGRALVVPGLGNRLVAFSTRFTPRFLTRRLAKRMLRTD